MSAPRRDQKKGSSSWTRLIPQQVLNYEEHWAKVCQVWKDNHTTQNHWPGGKNLNKKGKGQNKSQKLSNLSGKKKTDKKGKGKDKEKAPPSANVLSVLELADLSIQTAQSIDFSCYEMSKWNCSWTGDAQIISHQEKVVSSSIQNLDKHQKLKLQMGNT